MAAAYVRGYQEADLLPRRASRLYAKHYVGYGAAEGGRDYNSVDMSEGRLRARSTSRLSRRRPTSAATFMSSFNTLNGVPAAANGFVLRQILKRRVKLDFVVSDMWSIRKLVTQGVALGQGGRRAPSSAGGRGFGYG